MFSPELREMEPESASEPTSDPEAMMYARDGSASPKVFVLFVAAIVNGRASMVRFAGTNVIA